jgi:thermitase
MEEEGKMRKIIGLLMLLLIFSNMLSVAFVLGSSTANYNEKALQNWTSKENQAREIEDHLYRILQEKGKAAKWENVLDGPKQNLGGYSSRDGERNFCDISLWHNFTYVNGDKTRLIVGVNHDKFTSLLELEKIATKYNAIIVNTVSIKGQTKAVVVELPLVSVTAFIEETRIMELASYIEPNMKVQALLVPNDPYWSMQWGPQKIGADWAWNITLGAHDVLVAVVDTGIYYYHEDLGANYVMLGYDWVNQDYDPLDDHGHGTHCAGIIAATINNNVGIAGLAQVRVMAEKVLTSGGSGYWDWVANGIIHAVDAGADIISMSLGGYGYSELVHEAIRYAYDNGVLVIAAAGNENTNMKLYPAGYDEVIAVAATDEYDSKAPWSNWGDWIELAAPGVNIISTVPWGYESWSGTSMACPHVSGVAALVWSLHPEKTRDWVRLWLRYTADDLGDPDFDIYYGHGRVNARKAVEQVPPAHELIAYEWATPPYIEPGAVGIINANVLNFGESDEIDVMVQLIANGTLVNSALIDFLASGNLTTVSLSWTPTVEGLYNVTLSVVPVPGETSIENNVLWKYIYVGSPVKAVVLHSAGNILGEIITNWNALNSEWYQFGDIMIYIDYTTLNKEDITYGDIAGTEADVLIISCAFDPGMGWEFTDSEIKAIARYIYEGHGLIVTAGTFYYEVPNNNKLAPLFGLNENIAWYVTVTDLLHLIKATHPLFADVPNPLVFPQVGTAVPSDGRWDQNELVDGEYLALGHFQESAIVARRGLVYISPLLEVIPVYYHHHLQLLYNAITWSCYQKPEHELVVSLEVPKCLKPGESTMLNATVCNMGLSNETNVELQLLINGTVVDSVLIPELLTETSYTLSYLWAPKIEAKYNVTVHAPPLPDEEYTRNNFATKIVRVSIDIFYDEFDGGLVQWNNFGYPTPATFQDPGFWDGWGYSTEGDSWHQSGSWSKQFVDISNGVIVEFRVKQEAGNVWDMFNIIGIGRLQSDYREDYWPYYFGVGMAGHNPDGSPEGTDDICYVVYVNETLVREYREDAANDHQFHIFKIVYDGSTNMVEFYKDDNFVVALEAGQRPYDELPLLIVGRDYSNTNYLDWIRVLPLQKPEHDLVVSLDTPAFVELGNSILLNATVKNRGLNNETDVTLCLMINGTVVSSAMIPELLVGTSYTINYLWTPTTTGSYNITVYVPPMPGEDNTVNNFVTKRTYIFFYTRLYLLHEWVDAGNPMGWHDDDASWQYTLPFDFQFYGVNYRTIYISSNGLITFLGPDTSYDNSIPNLAGKLAIAPAWDDWVTYEPYDIYIWQNSTHVGIRWYVRAFGSSIVANFEAILNANGIIQFNYAYNNGPVSATIGISNGAGHILAESLTNLNYINSIKFVPYRVERNLAILSVECSAYEVTAGDTVDVAVVIENQGSVTEDLWVTAYASPYGLTSLYTHPLSSTRIYLDPSNYVFNTNTVSPGTKFLVTVRIDNVEDLAGWQVGIYYNDSIIKITRWIEPRWDPEYVYYGLETLELHGYEHVMDEGFAWMVAVALGPFSFTGSGKLCMFEFEITAIPPPGETYSCALRINHENTLLMNSDVEEIPAIKEDGYYELSSTSIPIPPIYMIGTVLITGLAPGENRTIIFNWNTTNVVPADYEIYAEISVFPDETDVTDNVYHDGVVTVLSPIIRDIAVIDITVLERIIYQGRNVDINVTVVNLGEATETFTVSLYYDEVLIDIKTVQNLTPNATFTLSFTWSTLDVSYGNYTLKAKASEIPGELNLNNNEYSYCWITITLLGDIDGNGRVGLGDLVLLAKAYGSRIGDPNWNSLADLAEPLGIISLTDLVTLAYHYGQSIQ